jgi:hypothetical protein
MKKLSVQSEMEGFAVDEDDRTGRRAKVTGTIPLLSNRLCVGSLVDDLNEGSESEDEDFIAKDESDVDEEFDSEYSSEGEGGGGEGGTSEKKRKSTSEGEEEEDDDDDEQGERIERVIMCRASSRASRHQEEKV